MLKKLLLSTLLSSMMVLSSIFTPLIIAADTTPEDVIVSLNTQARNKEIELAKSTLGNPILGFNASNTPTYGGDPAALVDGDTVYLYTGHDAATGNAYVIPEWQCYSTQDMINWTYEGVTLKASDISWANDTTSAWAGQVAKHYDKTAGKDKYYFYYCTWDKTDSGKQSIGVAVSQSPTGPFTDLGSALVKGSLTTDQSSNWNDIDPTVWIETDENGDEHRYLAWGNGKYFVCELNEDMISIKDLNDDCKITFGTDIIEKNVSNLNTYTEAPWLYRRQDKTGKPYGTYYLFYAAGWREQMAYATTDNLIHDEWTYGGLLMPPTATSNTNHMSVIDFQGKTYFIYHNGSLAGGDGYRRVACVEEFKFNTDGSINPIQETAIGISGTLSQITDIKGVPISHTSFTNSMNDSSYPYSNVAVSLNRNAKDEDALWEIVPGKADKSNNAYVSIESYNKPGLYLTVSGSNIVLSQDTTATTAMANNQTFRSVKGLNGSGVSLESVSNSGYYLTASGSTLTLTTGSSSDNCTFYIGTR